MSLEKKLSVLKILVRLIQLYILVTFVISLVNKEFETLDIIACIGLIIGYNVARSNLEFKSLFGPILGMIFSLLGIGYTLITSSFAGVIIFSLMFAFILDYAITIKLDKVSFVSIVVSIIAFLGLIVGVPNLPFGNLSDNKNWFSFNLFGKSDTTINKIFSKVEIGSKYSQVSNDLGTNPRYDKSEMENIEKLTLTTITMRYTLNSGENVYADIKYEINEDFISSRDKKDLTVISKELTIGDNRDFFANFGIDFSDFSVIDEQMHKIEGLSTSQIRKQNIAPVTYDTLVQNLGGDGIITYNDGSKKVYYFIGREDHYIKVTTIGEKNIVSNITGNIDKKDVSLNQNVYKF